MKCKKLLALLLAVVMAFALAACSKDDGTPSGSSGAGNQELASDVQAIVDRGVLRVGVKSDVPGFGLQDVMTEEYSGLEIDLAHKIAETLGIEKVEFTAVTAATRGQLLDSGDIDMVAATFTIKPDRLESWNFTTPYYTDAVSLLVKKDSGIADFADLEGKTIGVSTGSTSMDALIEAAGKAGVTLTKEANFSEYATYPEIKTALDAGRVDAFCVDGSILSGYLDDTVMILDSVRFSPQDYGIATKKTNTGWAAYLDDLITTWLADGTIDKLIADNGVAASYKEELAADVQAIVDRGVLRVGVKSDVPGFGLQDVLTEEYSGLEIDLSYKIAETLGIEKVEFTAVTAATRGQLLDSGDIDMVAATFTIKPDRLESWNFTTPYYTDAVSLLVKKDSGITGFADLEGKTIGVSTGSTSMDALIEAAGQAGVTLTKEANFSEYATYPEIKTALDAGRVDAFCVDGSILSGYLDDTVMILDSVRFSPQDYGIATKKTNTGWAAYLDDLITAWLADGTIDQLISDNGVAASYATTD